MPPDGRSVGACNEPACSCRHGSAAADSVREPCAEHAKLPCEERVHGCGQLLAEAARGPSDLHSQAAHVLKLALSEVSGGNAQVRGSNRSLTSLHCQTK